MGITFGTQIEVSSTGTRPNVTRLTDTKALVSYNNGVDAGDLMGTIVTLSGGSLTTGTEKNIDNVNDPRENRVARMSDTVMVIFYRSVSSNDSCAVVITISGTTIASVGTVLTLTDGMADNNFDIKPLTATACIVTYRDASNNLKSRILTVSGTGGSATLSEGASFTYSTGTGTRFNRLVALSTTKAVVNYVNGSVKPEGEVLDISGTTITGNTSAQLSNDFCGESPGDFVVAKLSSSKYILYFHNESTADGRFDGVIVDESSGTLTPGSTQDVDDGTNHYYESAVSGTTITETDAVTGDGDISPSGAAALDSSNSLLSANRSEITALTSTEAIAAFSNSTAIDASPIAISSVFSGYNLVLGGGQT